MKKFTLKNRNSLIPILLLSFLFAGAFSLSAEEYKSMIRYDRVWECYCDGYDPGFTIKCMKFVETEEINGKEYHKIETFRKTFPKIDYATDTYDFSNYVDGLHQHEGYMREENGVAYTLVVGYIDDLRKDDRIGPLFVPGKNEPGDNQKIIEIPVYDFTRKQGECYIGMSFCMEVSHLSRFTIIRNENIEIGGEEYHHISLYPDEVTENELYYGEEVIEGIGAIEYGCLNYHELAERPTKTWAQNYFTRLLDLDGNVIYNSRHDPLFDIPYGSFQDTNGIDFIENPKATAPIYDILGRRITEPAPGQLYIQGGKKHIAK